MSGAMPTPSYDPTSVPQDRIGIPRSGAQYKRRSDHTVVEPCSAVHAVVYNAARLMTIPPPQNPETSK
jgi:hypothetical protein